MTPSAQYTSPTLTKHFTTDESAAHTTQGRTTGPSQFIVDAGAVDKDMPSEPKDSALGRLRAQVTTLQDDLNDFFTHRMNGGKEEEWEKKLLDGGEDDDDDEDNNNE